MNFEVSWSNVKVTVAFYAKTMSAQYLGKFCVTVMVLGSKIGHGQ